MWSVLDISENTSFITCMQSLIPHGDSLRVPTSQGTARDLCTYAFLVLHLTCRFQANRLFPCRTMTARSAKFLASSKQQICNLYQQCGLFWMFVHFLTDRLSGSLPPSSAQLQTYHSFHAIQDTLPESSFQRQTKVLQSLTIAIRSGEENKKRVA